MEYCALYYHGPNDKLEIVPLPKDSTILTVKTTLSNLVNALNYLGGKGWELKKTINLKKNKWMQWMFERPLRRSVNSNPIEYCVVHHYGLGEKLEVCPENLLLNNAHGDDLIQTINMLSRKKWELMDTVNVKKTKITQYTFKRIQ